ncbi:MAG TPA: DUF2059 domain-containing protein [Thermoanaerobaculia bacterium]|nr:DUF2059 domain-containing protein [Thermoanaerobaculia bacterium]
MKRLILMTLLVLALAPAAWGAEPAAASHRQAATELMQVMNLEKAMVAGASAMLDAQVQANPEVAPYRDVIQKWMEKYLTWDVVGPQMTDLYVEAFTESELREMTAFYKTPTGQKALTKMPNLMKQGAQIGMEVGKQHREELTEMIKARKEELDKTKKPEGN